MGGLIDHLELYAGTIEGGWATDADGEAMPFQIVRLAGGPHEGTKTLATLGLSNHELVMRGSGRRVRQELLMIYRTEFGERTLPGLLQQVARECLETHQAYLQGDLIGPRDSLVAGLPFVALYACLPVYFPDEFAVYAEDTRPTVLSWLVPLTADESAFVLDHGWDAFERELLKQDPDLSDWTRSPMVFDCASR